MDKRNPISFFACKCPRCGKGPVFKNSIFKLSKFTETHDYCENCHLDYQPETGFFFGAMYFSYAIIVAAIVCSSIILSFFGKFDWAYWMVPVIVIVTLPLIFRYSRMLMLYVVYPSMYKDKYRHSFLDEERRD